MNISRVSGRRSAAAFVLVAALAAVAIAGAAGARSSTSNPKIAYLSFAVANSYDAPMLAAAKAAAKAQGAKITVFDANNDPKKQFSQLQTVDARSSTTRSSSSRSSARS